MIQIIKRYSTLFLCSGLLICLMWTTVLTTSSDLWSEQLLYLQTIIAIGGLITAISISFSKEKPHMTATDIVVAIWLAYVIIRTYFDDSHCSNAYRPVVGYITLVSIYAIIRIFPKQQIPFEKLLKILFLAITTYEIALGFWQIYSGTSHHHLYLATGSMFNPGPYSAYLTLGLTLAISILHDSNECDWRKRHRGVLLWACAAIVVTGYFLVTITRSRSAMIALALTSAWIFRKDIKRKYAAPLIIVIFGIICTLFYMKLGSAMGRIVIWRQALDIIFNKPLFGCGIGSFAGEYGKHLSIFFSNEYNAKTFAQYADVADYAFCDILQIFAEQGIIGGVLCITFTIFSLRALYRQSPHLALSLAALLIFSLFSYPMQLLPLQTITICLAAYSQMNYRGFSVSRWSLTALPLLCSFVAIICYNISKQRYDAQVEYKSFKGVTNTAFLEDYNRLLPLCSDNKQFLFDFAHLLQVDNRHFDACAVLRRGVIVSGDPMFWILMGNSLKSMNKYSEAIKCYDHAYCILPNRLYPLYQKMILYKETGDMKRAHQSARKIIESKPKVKSSATNRMIKEAKDML